MPSSFRFTYSIHDDFWMVLIILSMLFNRVSILIFPAYNGEHGVIVCKSEISLTWRYMCQVTTLDRISHFCVDIHYGRCIFSLIFIQFLLLWMNYWHCTHSFVCFFFLYLFCERIKQKLCILTAIRKKIRWYWYWLITTQNWTLKCIYCTTGFCQSGESTLNVAIWNTMDFDELIENHFS